MKEIIKILLALIALVFIVPLVWVLIKEIWLLIVPLFSGIAVGNGFWALLTIVSVGVIIWAIAS